MRHTAWPVVRSICHRSMHRVRQRESIVKLRKANQPRALSNSFPDVGLKIYVTTDAPNVYEDRLLTVAKAGTEHFHPTLLLFGTRLGIDRVTPTYREALKTVLQMPQSVGIAGCVIRSLRWLCLTNCDQRTPVFISLFHRNPRLSSFLP